MVLPPASWDTSSLKKQLQSYWVGGHRMANGNCEDPRLTRNFIYLMSNLFCWGKGGWMLLGASAKLWHGTENNSQMEAYYLSSIFNCQRLSMKMKPADSLVLLLSERASATVCSHHTRRRQTSPDQVEITWDDTGDYFKVFKLSFTSI